jgi:hypothetical protein
MDQRIDAGFQSQHKGKTVGEWLDGKVDKLIPEEVGIDRPKSGDLAITETFTIFSKEPIKPNKKITSISIELDYLENKSSFAQFELINGFYKCVNVKPITVPAVDGTTTVAVEWTSNKPTYIALAVQSPFVTSLPITEPKLGEVGGSIKLNAVVPVINGEYPVASEIDETLAIAVRYESLIKSQTADVITVSEELDETVHHRLLTHEKTQQDESVRLDASIAGLRVDVDELLDGTVHKSGAETITGHKTFTSGLTTNEAFIDTATISAVHSATPVETLINGVSSTLVTDDDLNNETRFVHTVGDEIVSGTKTVEAIVTASVAATTGSLTLGSTPASLTLRSSSRPALDMQTALDPAKPNQLATVRDINDVRSEIHTLNDYYWTFDTYADLIADNAPGKPSDRHPTKNDSARVRADETKIDSDRIGAPHTLYIYIETSPSTFEWVFDSIIETGDRDFTQVPITHGEVNGIVRYIDLQGQDVDSFQPTLPITFGDEAVYADEFRVGKADAPRRITSVKAPVDHSDAMTLGHAVNNYVDQNTVLFHNASASDGWNFEEFDSTIEAASLVYNDDILVPSASITAIKVTVAKLGAIPNTLTFKVVDASGVAVHTLGSTTVNYVGTVVFKLSPLYYEVPETDIYHLAVTASAGTELGVVRYEGSTILGANVDPKMNERLMLEYKYVDAVEDSQTGAAIQVSINDPAKLTDRITKLESDMKHNAVDRNVTETYLTYDLSDFDSQLAVPAGSLFIDSAYIDRAATKITRVMFPLVQDASGDRDDTYKVVLFYKTERSGVQYVTPMYEAIATAKDGDLIGYADVDWSFINPRELLSEDDKYLIGIHLLKTASVAFSTGIDFMHYRDSVPSININGVNSSIQLTALLQKALSIGYTFETVANLATGTIAKISPTSNASVKSYIDNQVAKITRGERKHDERNPSTPIVTIDPLASLENESFVKILRNADAERTIRVRPLDYGAESKIVREIEILIDCPAGQAIRFHSDFRFVTNEIPDYGPLASDNLIYMKVLLVDGQVLVTQIQRFEG